MNRKFARYVSFMVMIMFMGIMIWLRPAKGLQIDDSNDAETIRETILLSRRLDIEAAYTFDASILASVYINDPRGGEVPTGALEDIQAARHDESIDADDVGYLDYKQAVIEWRKSSYEQYMAELRLKQTTGTLTDTERLILVGETDGWSDLNQLSDISTVMPTPPCVTPSTQIAYPQPGWLP